MLGDLGQLFSQLPAGGRGTVVAAIATPIALAVFAAWWYLGPGALRRRKRARQELWLNVHAKDIQNKQARAAYEKAMQLSRISADPEAFEREVKRYD